MALMNFDDYTVEIVEGADFTDEQNKRIEKLTADYQAKKPNATITFTKEGGAYRATVKDKDGLFVYSQRRPNIDELIKAIEDKVAVIK